MESLLSYYPRNYDAYEEPVEIRSLEEGAVVAISVAVITGVYVNQVRNLQVITTTVSALCSQERQQVCSAGACRQEAGEAADGAP